MHLSQGKKVKLHCESSLLAVLAEASGGMLEKSSVSVTHSGQMGKGKQSDAKNHIFKRKGRKIIKRQRAVHKGRHTTVVSKTEGNQCD